MCLWVRPVPSGAGLSVFLVTAGDPKRVSPKVSGRGILACLVRGSEQDEADEIADVREIIADIRDTVGHLSSLLMDLMSRLETEQHDEAQQ
jgi:hypothetical protein